ncbi:MAG TPA: hypothetical protein VK495_01285 [Steroidobacteraceae bacterium]|jgi:hypothetical protein|nr:hypothetical protein [Steroidobacteraceae bacterium]
MGEFELKDPWHYPRPKLAEKYLKVFDIGLIAAQGLFAKRRMGKSEFLEKDLLPAKISIRTVYVDTPALGSWGKTANPRMVRSATQGEN